MDLLFSTLRLSTPLLFAALGGLLSERAGVINIALEGFMLIGAFTAAAVAHFAGFSAWTGWFAAFTAGGVFASLYALSTIDGRADQIVAGTAFNLLAAGFVPFLSKAIFDSTGSTPSLPIASRLAFAPTYWAFGAYAIVWLILTRTRLGLWLVVAGEHPASLRTAGISVRRVRYLAVIASGGLAGWGGAVLSLSLASSYSPMMSAGRGFIALAALISGRWRPWSTAIACLFFGLADAMQIRLQGVSIGGHLVPVAFIQIFPYVVTLAVLAGFIGGSRAPAALGRDLTGEEIL